MSTRPRWVLVALDFPPAGGGISRLLHALVTRSADEVEWRVITTTPGDRTEGVRRVNPARLLPALREELHSAHAAAEGRVVIGHPFLATPVLVTAQLARVPSSALVYGRELVAKGIRHRALLAGLRGVDRVLAISDATAEVVSRLGVRSSRLVVVHPALSERTRRIGPRPRLAGRGLRLVLVTRMAEHYKNIDLVHAVLVVLRQTGAVERCVVVGDGPLRSAYQREAQRAGLGDVLVFPGELSDEDMRSIVQESDLGVFPSRTSSAEGGFEGFGLVVHEFAAAGLPVLVGDAAGAREAAGQGWSLLLDSEDVGAWATTLHSLWSEPYRLARMATAADDWAARTDPALAVSKMVAGLRG